ncbi:PTS transporter subunit EIIC [Thermophilibacter immobilis]|uniref:PTS transporter subunit EIIC n=1 Tax=Thermophilibacter immobilis TaxID=2779519 RepID=UPI001E4AC38D|nr:PTS transporter subunit EIIC [Thermophilibacter immobilis]
MDTYEDLARQIIEDVGGPSNVSSVTHCFTRLRFTLKDNEAVREDHLRKLSGVAGTALAAGQYQVVIGNDVTKVYDAVTSLPGITGEGEVAAESVADEKPVKPVKKGFSYWINIPLNTMSSTITPVLNGLVVTGLFKAVLSILVLLGALDTTSQTYVLLNMMSDVFFYFMPFMIAWSASKHFKCNTVISLMLVGILLHPTFTGLVSAGDSVSLFGLPVHAISYSSSLLPALITVWAQSKVERLFSKTFFNKLGLIELLPTFIVMAPLTLLVTGPVGSIIGEVIASAMLALYQNYYLLGVFAVCLIMPVLILTGSHWILMPTALSNLSTLGFDPFLWVGFAVINFTQLAVSLAIFFKAKSREIKEFAGSAVLPIATAGVTEPCMYGLTLKLKKPLIATFVGCAVGGLYCGLMHVKVFELITVSLVSLPQFIDPAGGNNFVVALIGMALVFVVTFVVTDRVAKVGVSTFPSGLKA